MRINLFLYICFFINFSYGQKWGASTFGQFTNEALDVEIDASGNSYTTGYISGETAFNSSSVIPSTNGLGDIYIAKYAPNGSLIWIKTFGGNLSDRGIDLAIGADQNVVFTGQFFGAINFGAITLNSASASKDIFVAKIDPSGTIIWAIAEGGSNSENAYGITTDSQNNVILTGDFRGVSSIGGQSFNSIIDPNTGLPSFDFFISKYDSQGNPIWVVPGFAEYDDRGLAVAIDNTDNIYFTGQYSDTLQFGGLTYNNNGYNVGFLSKLSASGQVLFFNNFRAGSVLPYDLELNASNEVIVIGDFTGNMNYYDNTGAHFVSNPYSKQIFTIKTSNLGGFVWSFTSGSESDLSARSVSISPSKGIYLTGFFKCEWSELTANNQGRFNSVGFKDPYLLALSNNGTLLYAKQFGSKMNDEGSGIAIQVDEEPLICGNFTKDLNVPSNFTTGSNNLTINHQLNEFNGVEPPHYYFFGDSTLNSFLLKTIDASSPDYNYFFNQPNDSLEGYINSGLDTLHFCSNTQLVYDPLSYSHLGSSYNYVWNTGSLNIGISINTTGNYSVIVHRDDECTIETDSIYAISEPIPTLPLLSDNLGILTNQPGVNYGTYHFCLPQPIDITYSNLQAGTTVYTVQPNNTIINGLGPNTFNQNGEYDVEVQNEYCTFHGHFYIDYDTATTYNPIDLGISALQDPDFNDTITVCEGNTISLKGIDYITNPTGNYYEGIPYATTNRRWKINGSPYQNNDSVNTSFTPTYTGWYILELNVATGYNNICGLDTVENYEIDSLYIIINPRPNFTTSIIGDNLLCPNGSVFLLLSNTHSSLSWANSSGLVWTSSDNDSIEVNVEGVYNYSGTITDSITGCSRGFNFPFNVILKTAPNISLLPNSLICPYDSVQLSVPNLYSNYEWIGPNGILNSTTNISYGIEQGFYYVHIIDNEGCELPSPQVELIEYATPSISVEPNNYICNNTPTTIHVNYTGNATFQWAPPINSTADEITVTQPGTYSVTITQCGITITESVTIIDGSFTASITVSDSSICFGEQAIFSGTPSNANFEWNNGATTNGTYIVTSPGIYSALVTNEFGCTSTTNTIQISAVPGSSPPIIADQTICSGTDVVITDNSTYPIGWYTVNDTLVFDNTHQITILNVESDTSFLVSYNISGCGPAYDLVSIQVIDSLPEFTISGDSLLCPNESQLFTINTTSENVTWNAGSINLGTGNTITVNQNNVAPEANLTVTVSNQCFSRVYTDTLIYVIPQTINFPLDSVKICAYETLIVTLNENVSNTTWSGNFGTITSEDLELNSSIGNGTITVFAIDLNSCTTNTDSFVLTTSDLNYSIDTDFGNSCLGTTGIVQVNSNADSMNWSTPFGSFDTSYFEFTFNISNNGIATIVLYDQIGCEYHDSITIHANQIPVFELGADTIVCINDIYTYYFPNDTNTFIWTTYGGNTDIPITTNQTLILTATSPQGCAFVDTLVVNTVNCDDSPPNVITPNGDGINDYFVIDEVVLYSNNYLKIVNRWDNIVFEQNGYNNTFKGDDLSDGTYFYVFIQDPINNPEKVKKGFLTIFHN